MDMFDSQWMARLGELWNSSPEVFEPLQKAKFNSRIAYGFPGEDKPRGMIVVENGRVARAGAYDGEKLDWDLRASEVLAGPFIRHFGMMGRIGQ